MVSHTGTGEWQSFEMRMRARRAARLALHADAAVDAGRVDEALGYIEEARTLVSTLPALAAVELKLARATEHAERREYTPPVGATEYTPPVGATEYTEYTEHTPPVGATEYTEYTEHTPPVEATEYTEYTEHTPPVDATDYTEYTEYTEYAEHTKHTERRPPVGAAEYAEYSPTVGATEYTERAKFTAPIVAAEHAEYADQLGTLGGAEHADYADYPGESESSNSRGGPARAFRVVSGLAIGSAAVAAAVILFVGIPRPRAVVSMPAVGGADSTAAAVRGAAPETGATTPPPAASADTAATPIEREPPAPAPPVASVAPQPSIETPRDAVRREAPATDSRLVNLPTISRPGPEPVPALSIPARDAAASAPAPAVPSVTPQPLALPEPPAASAGALSAAAAAAPAPEASTEPAPEALIRGTLNRYAAAYSALDATAAQRVWPGVDRAALVRAFDSLDSQHVTLGDCRVSVAGENARAICVGTTQWTPRVGSRVARTDPRRWEFQLTKADQGWRIVSARVQNR